MITTLRPLTPAPQAVKVTATMSAALLNTAVRAARNAGKLITRYVGRIDTVKITQKKRHDFVTEVDKLAEQEIIGTLTDAYPDFAILAEESGARDGAAADKPVWIIDPLDGTTNFIHGIPHFSVSIALKAKDQLQIGVVYDPIRNELFTAIRGEGAKLNDRKIRVAPGAQLQGALVGTGFPYHQYDYLDRYLAILRQITIRTSGIRRAGSAALDLAYTAAGRLDGFWEFNLQAWDLAAGALLVQEAGGIVTDFNGKQDYMTGGDIVCGPANAQREMLQIIKQVGGN